MPKTPVPYVVAAILLVLLMVENYAIFSLNRRCGDLEGQLRVLQVRVAQLSARPASTSQEMHGARASETGLRYNPAARLLACLTVLQHDPQAALSAADIGALDQAIRREEAAFDSAQAANQKLFALMGQLEHSFTPAQQAFLQQNQDTVKSKAFELSSLAQREDISLYEMLRQYVHHGCRPM